MSLIPDFRLEPPTASECDGPTLNECESMVKVWESGDKIGYATWLPLGGEGTDQHCARAIVVVDKKWDKDGPNPDNGSIEIYAWCDVNKSQKWFMRKFTA